MTYANSHPATPQDAAPDKLAHEHRDHVCGRVGHCTAECAALEIGAWRISQLASIPATNGDAARWAVIITDVRADGRLVHVQRTGGDLAVIGWVPATVLRQVEPALVVYPPPDFSVLVLREKREDPAGLRRRRPRRPRSHTDAQEQPSVPPVPTHQPETKTADVGSCELTGDGDGTPWNPTPEQIAGYW
jgi:hypothetical protein